MSLADLFEVMEEKIVVNKWKDDSGNPIEVTIRPLTLEKLRVIIENYGIFVEELVLKKIKPEELKETEYVRNFGHQKLDEAISYIIAVALDQEDMIERIHIDLPWETKTEILYSILKLSLPEDKKKAQEQMEEIFEMVLEPLMKILEGGRQRNSLDSEKKKKEE